MSQTAIAQLTKNMMVFNVVVLSLGYFNVIPYKWSLYFGEVQYLQQYSMKFQNKSLMKSKRNYFSYDFFP